MLSFCLPVVSPQGGDPNATSRGERFAPTRAPALVSVYENIPSWDSSDDFQITPKIERLKRFP